jgi:hypothetical protein
MRYHSIISICALIICFSSCGTTSHQQSPQPAPTVILQGEPNPTVVTSPPPIMSLNQSYQLSPFIVDVTHFDTNVDPSIPDIRNAAPWMTIEGYRWILFNCLITNTSEHTIAPGISVVGSIHQNGVGENYNDSVDDINGYDVTDLSDPKQFNKYIHITPITPHTTIRLRVYFYTGDWGLADFVIGTLDPTQSVYWNYSPTHWTNQNVQRFFTVNLPKPTG